MNQLVMERTVEAGRGRTRHDGRPERTAGPGRPWRTIAAVVAGVLAVLVAATVTLLQGWGRGPVAGPDEIAVDGGLVHVDGALSAARPQHAMPGMGSDEDPVADGDRRISVDVTLRAVAGPMSYTADGFVLEVDGEPAKHLSHRDILPGTELPEGTQLSGTLMFDVPADATTARLAYRGEGATTVVLPAEQEQTSTATAPADGADHATGGHGSAPATSDAGTAVAPTDG